MDYEYDCFISYAHKDNRGTQFAQQLAGWLEQAQLRVWRDSTGLLGGEPVKKSIQDGLRSARCLVCLVTEAWYDSDFAQWELQAFLEDPKEKRKVVPVLLTKRDVGRLGPELTHRRDIRGLDDPNERPAAFWELLCTLKGIDTGPEAEWASRGQEILNCLPAGHGGLRIHGLPDGVAVSAVRVSAQKDDASQSWTPWDGKLLLLRPGGVRVVLWTVDLYDEQTLNISAGMISEVRLNPTGVISSEAKRHAGTGEAGETHIDIVYERTTQQVLAARIAHVANRIAGHSVRLDQWVYFKEKGDGAIERYASVNTLFYHGSDKDAAQRLHNRLRHAEPPIRLAMHQVGDQATSRILGVEPVPGGLSPGLMLILLLEAR